jgi:quercetin dioxygenase-like cupin family protein
MSAQSDSYGSRDFWRTRAALETVIPDRLIHKGVAKTDVAGADTFSKERRHPVFLVDLPSKTLSMTLGGLEPGQTTSRHRHNYETVLYVIEGRGVTTIEDREVEWEAGDAVYIPVWAWHQHRNISNDATCLYVACENAPLLQNLGGIALREEAG